jgi:hypothetical protein
LRWGKDVYTVKTGGHLTVVLNQPQDGPHTFTVVKAKDLPKTAKQVMHCEICNTLGTALGSDPNRGGQPKFKYLENGVASKTPPKLDRPGDTGITGSKPGSKITFHVTAKAGTTLSFMCLFHPWMQAKLKFVK